MKLNKKLLAASVAAMFIAAPAYADNTITPEDQLELIENLLDDSLDLDDGLVRTISGAINLAPIDASVNISGNSIDFNGANSASATANSTADSAVLGANATVSAIANATSGNSIVTNAIGAVNDSSVKVDNAVGYIRENNLTYSSTLEGDYDTETAQDAVEGGAIAGEYAFLTGLGGLLMGQAIFGGSSLPLGGLDPNVDFGEFGAEPAIENAGVATFQAAYNTGDINASVNITSASLDNNYYYRGLRDNLDISDLAISTTAIGAVNKGSVEVVNSLIVDVQSTVNYSASAKDSATTTPTTPTP